MTFGRTELSDINGTLITTSWEPCVITFTPWPPTAVQVSSTGLAPVPGIDWPVWVGLTFILAVATIAAGWLRRHEGAFARRRV